MCCKRHRPKHGYSSAWRCRTRCTCALGRCSCGVRLRRRTALGTRPLRGASSRPCAATDLRLVRDRRCAAEVPLHVRPLRSCWGRRPSVASAAVARAAASLVRVSAAQVPLRRVRRRCCRGLLGLGRPAKPASAAAGQWCCASVALRLGTRKCCRTRVTSGAGGGRHGGAWGRKRRVRRARRQFGGERHRHLSGSGSGAGGRTSPTVCEVCSGALRSVSSCCLVSSCPGRRFSGSWHQHLPILPRTHGAPCLRRTGGGQTLPTREAPTPSAGRPFLGGDPDVREAPTPSAGRPFLASACGPSSVPVASCGGFQVLQWCP